MTSEGFCVRGAHISLGVSTLKAQALAVLFDRDGTIIVDVPDNADPLRVTPMQHAHSAFRRLRDANIRTAVVSNQAGVAMGRLTSEDVRAVNARAEELLGPLGPVFICEHSEVLECDCRKPKPGLIYRAAAALGVRPGDCVVVGDIGADMGAARAAGARGILVPTPRTRPEEVLAAPAVALHLDQAVDAILEGDV